MISARPPRTRRARLGLEALEDRWLPAGGVVTWINPGGGDWNVGANWSGGAVPTALDDAVIGSGVVVSYSSQIGSVHSVSCDGSLVLSGGILTIVQSSQIAALTV